MSLPHVQEDDHEPLSVLVVQEKWRALIASGQKTLEIRATSCHPRTVALAASGTQTITHLVDITGSFAVTREQLKGMEGHCIEDVNTVKYEKPHAWTIANVRKLRYPVRYQPKRGCINFFPLTAATIADVYEAIVDVAQLEHLFEFL